MNRITSSALYAYCHINEAIYASVYLFAVNEAKENHFFLSRQMMTELRLLVNERM